MIKTSYQTPELRNANNEVVQEGAFGKNTALSNSTNDGWIDYVMNDLEALHDTIGDSAPTLDGNGHVVEPANKAIGDEDGNRIKNSYIKTTGGTIHGILNVSRMLQMYDNQDNILGGILASPTTTTDRFMVLFGGDGYNNAANRLYFYNTDGNQRFALQTGDGTTNYSLIGFSDGRLTWRGNPVATLNAPAFTGNPTAPTQAVNNNSLILQKLLDKLDGN